MCGLAGFFGDFDKNLLPRMGSVIQHRGPDNTGIWCCENLKVGLVHTRLSILDLRTNANQPMSSDCGRAKIVFNGEIYNYRQLREDLVEKGVTFKTTGDTEVVLKLYIHYGIDFLSKLNGIFVISIFDLERRSLFLARDGQGVKPLYYSELSRGFLFASELKALVQEKSLVRSLNPEAIAAHLTFLYAPGKMTMLKNVYKLLPGHYLEVKEGKIIKISEFYDYPAQTYRPNKPKNYFVENTRKYLEQAVNKQLVSDVPVGAFLSGGLDSSAVVAIAKKMNPDLDLPCFTIDFEDNAFENEGMARDLPYAERVAKHLGIKLNKVTVGSEMLLDLEKMIYHLDEPQADPAPLNAMQICALAKAQGIKVLLSGTGGDDIFTGYRRHYAIGAERFWGWLPKKAREFLRYTSEIKISNRPALRRFRKAFQYADLEASERLVSYFFWLDPKIGKSLFSANFSSQFKDFYPQKPFMDTLGKLPDGLTSLQQMLYLEQKHFLTDHNLNYTDKVSMAHGVEVRVPLLDPDLISWASTIPDKYKQNGSVGKWVFKKSMENYLPKDVIYRPKTGFGAPLRHWMNNDLRPLFDDILSNSSIEKRGIFDYESVQRLRSLDLEKKGDYSYPLFAIVCLELWCRIFIDA